MGLFKDRDDFKFYLLKDNLLISEMLKEMKFSGVREKEDCYLFRKDILGS